jgi:hypothetical protein
MTKIKHFGISTPSKPNLKPIELVKFINEDGDLGYIEISSSTIIKNWENVILMVDKKLSDSKYDIIYLYDDESPKDGIMYLGHWNDGVIE